MRRSRMLGWDRNPLRRRIDRVEAAMVAGLIAVFLIAAPVLAAAAGHWTSSASMQQQRAEAAWRVVPATVQGSAPWDNSPAARGSARVWVTRSGSPTGPPLRYSQVQAHIAIAEWVTVLVLALLLCLAGSAGRVLLAQRRLADWNRAWRVAEPGWTRKR